MNGTLRNRLVTAAAGGTLAIASALIAWHEGDGPTQVVDGVKYHLSYRDSAGIWTVCRGLTGAVAGPGKRYSAAQCEVMEAGRLQEFEAGVRRLLPGYDSWSPWRQASLLSFVWNVGEANLASSTLRRKFNAGDDEGGCRELARWVKSRVNGVLQVLRGLVTRRNDEMALCLGRVS